MSVLELTERIIARKEGAVGWLIFNNPERRNAVSVDMWEAIPRVLAEYEADPQVRVIHEVQHGGGQFWRRSRVPLAHPDGLLPHQRFSIRQRLLKQHRLKRL